MDKATCKGAAVVFSSATHALVQPAHSAAHTTIQNMSKQQCDLVNSCLAMLHHCPSYAHISIPHLLVLLNTLISSKVVFSMPPDVIVELAVCSRLHRPLSLLLPLLQVKSSLHVTLESSYIPLDDVIVRYELL